MKVNRKYIAKPPPRHELRKFVSQLMAVSRQMKELLPHSQGWEINLREMMVEVSSDDSPPFMSGMMFSEDRTQDDMFAHSLADDILSHIRRY
jgi:hypothetical protein